jgi:hypothetical protein
MMRKLLWAACLLLISNMAGAVSGPVSVWGGRITGSGTDEIKAIAGDNTGNVYVAGKFSGTGVDFDPGPGVSSYNSSGAYDAFLAKYSSTNTLVWVVTFGGAGADDINAMTVDGAGNIFIAGSFSQTVDLDPGAGTATYTAGGNSDIFAARYSPSGTLTWAAVAGSNGTDAAYGIGLDGYGDVLIAGDFTGTVDFDPSGAAVTQTSQGLNDGFLWKLNSTTGVFSAVRTWGGSNIDHVNGLAVGTSVQNNIIITGNFYGTTDFDWGAGTTSKTASGSSDGYVLAVSQTLLFSWVGVIGGTNTDEVLTVNVDATAMIEVAGYFQGVVDFDPSGATYQLTSGNNGAYASAFVMQFTNTGTMLWANALAQTQTPYNRIYAISSDASSNVYVTGASDDFDADPTASVLPVTCNYNETGYLVKYNANGVLQWATALDLNGRGLAMDIDAQSSLFLAGKYMGSADINPTPMATTLPYASSEDAFYAKYKVCNLPAAPTLAVTADTVCEGGSYVYTATGTGQVSWYSVADGNSYLFGNNYTKTFTTTGVYTYYAQDSNSCGAGPRKDLLVRVVPVPQVNISGGFGACVGQGVTITASGADSYLWEDNSTSPTRIVTPGTTPTAVTVTGTNAYGCTGSAGRSIQQYPYPVSNATALVAGVCSGNSQQLFVHNEDADIEWSTTETTDTITVQPLQTTDYYITLTSYNGCVTVDTVTATVYQYPQPDIQAQAPAICTGTGTTLADANNLQAGFEWSTGENTATINVAPLQTTTYYATVTSPEGCVAYDTATVTVNSVTAQIQQQSNVLTAQPGGLTYQWLTCNGDKLDGQTNATFTPAQTGSYSVLVTSNEGCVDTSDCVSVTISGIANTTVTTVLLYPNPAANMLSVTLYDVDNVTLATYSTDGKLIETLTPTTNLIKLDVSHYAQGIYILQVNKNGATAQYRFVKQ